MLTDNGLDPEKWVVEDFSADELKRRQRRRGIHSEPAVERIEDDQIDITENLNELSANETVPDITENARIEIPAVFRPRRRTPDEQSGDPRDNNAVECSDPPVDQNAKDNERLLAEDENEIADTVEETAQREPEEMLSLLAEAETPQREPEGKLSLADGDKMLPGRLKETGFQWSHTQKVKILFSYNNPINYPNPPHI